jgi:hypothetical protein
MSTVQNNITAGQADGYARVTFWGQSLASNKIGLYSFIIGLPQEGVSYDDGNILSRAVETEDVFNCKGGLATKQSGNQVVEEKTFSIDYNDDYNFAVNSINPLVNRSTMKAILEGTKFIQGDDEVAVLGTQGFRWLGTPTFETLDIFYAFEQDGKLIAPDQLDADGNPELIINSIKAPYEKSALIMVEFLYTKAGITKGDRFVYCMPMTSTFSEGTGTSPNSYSIEVERMSDKRSIGGYLVDGSGLSEVPTSGDVYDVTVDYLFNVATLEDPDEVGDDYIGKTALILKNDGTEGKIIELTAGPSNVWADVVGATWKKGCKVLAKAISTELATMPTDSVHNLVIVKADVDTSSDPTAITAFPNILPSGGDPDYFYPVYDWLYSETKFDAYEGQ